MEVRCEQSGDESAIRAVHEGAFRQSEDPEATPPEAGLVDALRASAAWLPRLSVVAIIDGHIAGHVVCTRAHVETAPVLALGPIGVDPARQNQGVGKNLMNAVIAAADVLGEPLIGLVGSPPFYARFGFVRASDLGIQSPEPTWGEFFQVRTLSKAQSGIKGRFVNAEPYSRV
jgi:putative acetyltransferase